MILSILVITILFACARGELRAPSVLLCATGGRVVTQANGQAIFSDGTPAKYKVVPMPNNPCELLEAPAVGQDWAGSNFAVATGAAPYTYVAFWFDAAIAKTVVAQMSVAVDNELQSAPLAAGTTVAVMLAAQNVTAGTQVLSRSFRQTELLTVSNNFNVTGKLSLKSVWSD